MNFSKKYRPKISKWCILYFDFYRYFACNFPKKDVEIHIIFVGKYARGGECVTEGEHFKGVQGSPLPK